MFGNEAVRRLARETTHHHGFLEVAGSLWLRCRRYNYWLETLEF